MSHVIHVMSLSKPCTKGGNNSFLEGPTPLELGPILFFSVLKRGIQQVNRGFVLFLLTPNICKVISLSKKNTRFGPQISTETVHEITHHANH